MIHINMDILEGKDFEKEISFTASRSSGPGGQNVNKLSTRVELRFDVNASEVLSDKEKNMITDTLASKITKDGILRVVSQSERTQNENRLKTIEKFNGLLRKALTPVKKRIRTKPTLASKQKRIQNKKQRSIKKELRRQPGDE